PGTSIVLISRSQPTVKGGHATLIGKAAAAGRTQMFSVSATSSESRVAADGAVWRFRQGQAIPIRLHLTPAPPFTAPAPPPYGVDDARILSFFARPPRLVIELSLPPDHSRPSQEEILNFLDSRVLLAGVDREPVPDYSFSLRDLTANATWSCS